MFYKLSTLVLFLMLAAPGVALAQGTGTLAGTVVDDLGDPLPGANVQLGGTTLGAATDFDGNYRIIGVPVGNYDVTASFVGYQEVTISGVDISSGYTRELNFELSEGTLMDGIEIVYERPLIQKDAIGVPKVISGEDIENLPVRGVADVAALQSGVVSESGSDDLFIRGSREEEVVYFVDGVKITSTAQLAVNQQAIQEQEMLIGTIPARYGDVQSGVISITTKSGSDKFFGSAELITSEVLDDYGYNLASLSVGGPIVPGKASFFLSAGGTTVADNSPYYNDRLQLTDDALGLVQQYPQAFQVTDSDGGVRYLPVPTEGRPLDGVDYADLSNDYELVNSYLQSLVDGGVISADDLLQEGETLGPDLVPVVDQISNQGFNSPLFSGNPFESVDGKDNPFKQLTINGNITVNPIESMNIRLGGTFQTQNEETYNYNRSLFNRSRFYQDDEQSWRLSASLRQRFSNTVFAQIQTEYSAFSERLRPDGFSDDVSDIVNYGNISAPQNAVPARYYRQNDGVLSPSSDGSDFFGIRNSFNLESAGSGLFSGAGAPITFYRKRDNRNFRMSGSATAQLGVHQLEVGGEFERSTRRLFQLFGGNLARFVADPDDPLSPLSEEGDADGYENIIFEGFEGSGSYRSYGYSYNGLDEVDDQDINLFYDDSIQPGDPNYAGKYDVAPYQPIYGGMYLQDKIEYGDLVLNLGVRLDYFDNNTVVPKDIFDPYPIYRAGEGIYGDEELEDGSPNDLYQGEGFAIPSNIADDYAVYFNDSNTIVAYRDADGTFFDATGNTIPPGDIRELVFIDLQGQTVANGARSINVDSFEDYKPEWTFMPRIGVSFPVTDRALFFASYNVTSQRPTEEAFAEFPLYEGLSGQNRIPNSNLRPEKTTQYELGLRQRIGERAAFTLSGFYRTQENKIGVRTLTFSRIGYSTFLNSDFTTTKGMELAFDLRRSENLSANINYTLSFAQGTGSDARAAALISWRGGYVPDYVLPSDFDRRHVLNASLDYRLGEDEGPRVFGSRLLENFGANLLVQAQSGMPFTAIEESADATGATTLPGVVGDPNSLVMPGSVTMNLKLDRGFNLGPANLKAYLWVLNLLDTEIVNNVYKATGQPDDDGYTGNFLPNNSIASFQYQQFIQGPTNESDGGYFATGGAGGRFYGLPRRVRLGLLINF